MRHSNHGRRIAASAMLIAVLAVSLPGGAQGLITKPGKPHVSTGGVTHVHGTSGQLEGIVNPTGLETAYYFQYGPTIAYGAATPAAPVGSGAIGIKVGKLVDGLLAGYHYRIVASNSAGVALGADRVFTPKTLASQVVLPKEPRVVVYGSPLVLSGRVTGTGNVGRKVVLQTSAYPYLAPFATVSAPATTNAQGAFSFRVTNLFASVQMRAATLDVRPLYSAVVRVQVAVRVTFHARASARAGLTRLYGTVTPALSGAVVRFQVAKAVRPGKSEKETAFVNQFRTKVKAATHSFSRFSIVVRLRHTGNYRALVKPRAGALVAGSSNHLKLHAAAAPKRKKRG
jgi:hypothetical protein